MRANERTWSLAGESKLLILICLADLASTLILLKGGHASEGNPLMSFYLGFGVWAFVGTKLALVGLPVFIAEWSMRFRPRFVKRMLRGAIAAYVGIYALMFLSVNVLPVPHGRLATDPPAVTSARVEN